ncbi:MAG TPA: S8 family serine peptidase, partial [Solirubrobacteraceae bacterium]|nr:S8 family serine peptidase [Solirubrobacteraceae bacterium]
MRPALRIVACTVLSILALAAPAAAATPESGTVSLAQPTTSWSGKANGYLFTIANDYVGTCAQPYCDTFALTLAEAGQLTVEATAATGSGFTRVEIERPDGTFVSDGGAADHRETRITIKQAEAGEYTVWVLTNRPATADGSYSASATLAPAVAGGGFSGPAPGLPAGKGEGGPKDATVIAVIDSGINPYHWDFLASRMPQHLDGDTGNDLPLHRPASEWLPGFPQPGAFASVNRLDLSIEENAADTEMDLQREEDAAKWEAVEPSKDDQRHLNWMPGTKVIGALTYDANGALLGANDDHGVGVTSSTAGNQHGTCPECLLFFINHGTNAQSEKAIEWAMSQPWIDVVTNSYGFHVVGASNFRPNVYSGSNTGAQRTATERGQTVFFSAGNGVENGFITPNLTTFSSQKGPDWMVTVGAVTPGEDGHYEALGDDAYEEKYGPFLGAGKPVDLAGVGSDYPTAYYAETVSGTGSFGFGGTSNATPHVAGLYARTLYLARTLLKGQSRTQSAGVIADGKRVKCAAARPSCELGDGRLTARELRDRLFYGTLPSLGGLGVGGQGTDNPTLPKVGEEMLLSEGHGVYRGRVAGREVWESEQDRVLGPMLGTAKALERPAGEREWFIVDSYCRQKNWGSWEGGYYVEGRTALPADDASHPVRAAWARTCPGGKLPPAGSQRAAECEKAAHAGA